MIRYCECYNSSFDRNIQYLIIKNFKVEFEFSELKQDYCCSKEEKEIYIQLYRDYATNSQDSNIYELSILFIFPIECIPIPDPFQLPPLFLTITLNDFRPLYYLTWSQIDVNEDLEKFIDSLDERVRIEVNLIPNIRVINGIFTSFSVLLTYQEKINNKVEYKHDILKQIWKKLLSKNIYSIRVDEIIKDEWLADLLVEFCSSESFSQENKLNDIELKLNNTKDVKRILEALENNFMIKTVRLETDERVDLEIEKIAEEFRSKRIGTEIGLNCKNKRFRTCEDKCVEIFYPNDEKEQIN